MDGAKAAQKRREKAKRLFEASISAQTPTPVAQRVADSPSGTGQVDAGNAKKRKVEKRKDGNPKQTSDAIAAMPSGKGEDLSPSKESGVASVGGSRTPGPDPKRSVAVAKENNAAEISDRDDGGWAPKSLYSKLPASSHVAHAELPEEPAAQDFDLETFLEERLGGFDLGQYASRVEDKVLILGKTESLWKSIRKKRQAQSQQKGKGAKPKELRRIKKLQGSDDAYDKLVPLNRCWMAYVRTLMGGRALSKSELAELFAKIDLLGAIVVVASAACSTSVGLRGIVARETANTFVLCGTDGRFRIVAKKGSALNVTIGSMVFTLQGDRVAARWK